MSDETQRGDGLRLVAPDPVQADQEVIPHLSADELAVDLDSFLTAALDCAEALNRTKTDRSRELSCVITKLEEAAMWRERDIGIKSLAEHNEEGGR